jgi:hypothetical protein
VSRAICKVLALAAALAVLSPAGAAAEPSAPAEVPEPVTITFAPGEPLNVRLTQAARCTLEDERVVLFPSGTRIIGETEWTALDTEVRRLQDAETRLQAENDSFRKSARSAGPNWGTVTLAASAFIAGMAAARWAFDR